MGWLSPPMPWITLGQMRRSGRHWVEATCLACGHNQNSDATIGANKSQGVGCVALGQDLIAEPAQ